MLAVVSSTWIGRAAAPMALAVPVVEKTAVRALRTAVFDPPLAVPRRELVNAAALSAGSVLQRMLPPLALAVYRELAAAADVRPMTALPVPPAGVFTVSD